MSELPPTCVLCNAPGGHEVYTGRKLRVIRADEPGFPAFYRVVWTAHAPEFSDLSSDDRMLCMQAVVRVEECLRHHLSPTKINLAALGNVVPHLHWHVVARFDWDTHFPAPVWAAPQRPRDAAREAALLQRREALEAGMATALAALDP